MNALSRCRVASILLTGWTLTTAGASAGARVRAEEPGWKPAAGPLLTRWAKDVSPERVHPEYPRPQLTRSQWQSLNGLWSYAIRPRAEEKPAAFAGSILVPFPAESALSGVMRPVGQENRLWYRRTVSVPPGWRGQRVLLHFGAVDWECRVWVNGQEVGTHRGGYDPFSFDVTSTVRFSGEEEVVVAVWDPTDAGPQPRGKQVARPRGIWYTSVTGIWQSVWLEPVPEVSVESLRITPDVDASSLRLDVSLRGPASTARIRAVASDNGRPVAEAAGKAGEELSLPIPGPKLWSPDSPYLYDLKVEVELDGARIDAVGSYFGMRKISIEGAEDGHLRLFLNHRPLFQFGPLDQGFWPDGIYTAPTDEALRHDIEVTRALGFNMARKHVKVEPDRWYWWCDKLGLLVWQDMPSGDRYIGGDDPDLTRSEESSGIYERELRSILAAFQGHPSIIMWVPFNEGWGQFDTARICDLIKAADPTRLVNNASGWTDRGVGDVLDIHAYPGPGAPPVDPRRAGVLGEFGGLGLPVRGHTWQNEANWGYRSFTNAADLTEAYVRLVRRLRPLIGASGLSAAVYTQTTDVEIEVNGLLTYDRALVKMDQARISAANRQVYLPPPRLERLVASAAEEKISWRFTVEKPADGWEGSAFADGAWREGPGGFGTPGTPGANVGTEWSSPDIWVRRSFDLPAGVVLDGLELWIHHDEDAEVYLNGVLAASLEGYSTSYESQPVNAPAKAALKPGKNTIAIHCHQTRGGQFIDCGLNLVTEALQR